MNTRPYRENENPFAYDTENAQMQDRRTNRETPFTFFGDNTTSVPDPGPVQGVNRATNTVPNVALRLITLKRWNLILRLGASVFCLATILLLFFARQTKSDIRLADGSEGKGTATYKFNGSFKFLLFVHVVVLLYALVLSALAIVMSRKGLGQSTPPTLMWPAFILNLITSSFLLLAFAAAVAVEVVARQGLTVTPIQWLPLCGYFGLFCAMNEFALATAGLAYACLAAGTCIDAYFIHLYKL
ncbi:unnamed protein product [Calypogeia fissa]